MGIILGMFIGWGLAYRSDVKANEAEATVFQAMSIDIVKSPTADLIDSLIERRTLAESSEVRALEMRVEQARRDQRLREEFIAEQAKLASPDVAG